MCVICEWLSIGKTHGWEVETCETCGHFYIPYTEDCECGMHTLPPKYERDQYLEQWEHEFLEE